MNVMVTRNEILVLNSMVAALQGPQGRTPYYKAIIYRLKLTGLGCVSG